METGKAGNEETRKTHTTRPERLKAHARVRFENCWDSAMPQNPRSRDSKGHKQREGGLFPGAAATDRILNPLASRIFCEGPLLPGANLLRTFCSFHVSGSDEMPTPKEGCGSGR